MLPEISDSAQKQVIAAIADLRYQFPRRLVAAHQGGMKDPWVFTTIWFLGRAIDTTAAAHVPQSQTPREFWAVYCYRVLPFAVAATLMCAEVSHSLTNDLEGGMQFFRHAASASEDDALKLAFTMDDSLVSDLEGRLQFFRHAASASEDDALKLAIAMDDSLANDIEGPTHLFRYVAFALKDDGLKFAFAMDDRWRYWEAELLKRMASTEDASTNNQAPPTRRSMARSKDPKRMILCNLVREWKDAGLSQQEMCDRFDARKIKTPGQTKWSGLTWRSAFLDDKCRPSVAKWLTMAGKCTAR